MTSFDGSGDDYRGLHIGSVREGHIRRGLDDMCIILRTMSFNTEIGNEF